MRDAAAEHLERGTLESDEAEAMGARLLELEDWLEYGEGDDVGGGGSGGVAGDKAAADGGKGGGGGGGGGVDDAAAPFEERRKQLEDWLEARQAFSAARDMLAALALCEALRAHGGGAPVADAVGSQGADAAAPEAVAS